MKSNNTFDIKAYETWVNEKNYEELKVEKLTLGKLISDTASRIQDVSGGDDMAYEMLESHVSVLKELKAKLGVIIKQMQKRKD
jgi:hypothetical protein